MGINSQNGSRPKPFATSLNGVPLRLGGKQLGHIARRHPEVFARLALVRKAIEQPDQLLKGETGEIIAVKRISPRRLLLAVYRELDEEGYVVAAFFASQLGYHSEREQLWP